VGDKDESKVSRYRGVEDKLTKQKKGKIRRKIRRERKKL